MIVDLAYGTMGIKVDVPDSPVVLRQKFIPGIEDIQSAIVEGLESPVNLAPLRELIFPGMKLVILHTDITRATPNRVILPVLLSYLERQGLGRDEVTLINGLGTHRAQSHEEMVQLLGSEIVERYNCLQHDGNDPDNLVVIGESSFGHQLAINRLVAEADLRILTGFIEPHFFAGFSGGPKAILPGTAGAQTIQQNHGYGMISHPAATFGETLGNPIWEEMREVVDLVGPNFLLNVTLNAENAITGIFTGDVLESHQAGCRFVKQNAMAAVEQPFDVVLTTNSGYPLDQNLYQSIKGISAASQIVRPGGAILLAARCIEGLPDHGGYASFLRDAGSVEAVLEMLSQPDFTLQDQWQVQVQAQVQQKADVYVYSEGLTDQQIREALFIPSRSLESDLTQLMQRYGERVCVLPEGPLTIPFVAKNE